MGRGGIDAVKVVLLVKKNEFLEGKKVKCLIEFGVPGVL